MSARGWSTWLGRTRRWWERSARDVTEFSGLLSAVIPCSTKKKPVEIPDFGEGYQAYYRDQARRFMQRLPACLGCGQCEFDRFVNNVNYPRFESGREMGQIGTDTEIALVDAFAVLIAYRLP